jgi:hypothetical protein
VKPLAQQNYYEILDVPFDAPPSVIAEAVERAQALYAPGSLATYTLMDPEEEQLLVHLLEEARSTLLDPAARARYDERITGPEEATPATPPHASPALEATIRAAWPELPPVIPASPLPPAESDEEWDDVETETPPPAAPVAAVPPPALPPVIPALAPSAAPPRAPILLSREVAVPPAPVAPPPAATPVPVAAPAPAATPAPVASAAPALTPPPAQGGALPPIATLTPPVLTTTPGEGTTWSGEVLRQIREARGITLQQISDRTKVTRHHIENIEADRFDSLPASVYLRGILLSIARELRLDGQKVARSYLERVTAASAPAAPPPRQR